MKRKGGTAAERSAREGIAAQQHEAVARESLGLRVQMDQARMLRAIATAIISYAGDNITVGSPLRVPW